MATEEGKTISLNVLVDKQRNRVVFVESNNDFIDILLSFLTIPVGTVLRLARKQKQPCGIGCMDNLYQSLEDFDSELFEKESLRHMLLRPENLAGALCKRLKINIDDTELTKYYVCPQLTIDTYYSRQHASSLLSISNNEQCSCGELMSLPINLSDEKVEDGNIEDRGVFVNALKGISFTVTDDIQILPFSTETSFAHLNALGIKRMNELDEKTINVGVEEKCCYGRVLMKSLRSHRFSPSTRLNLRVKTQLMLNPQRKLLRSFFASHKTRYCMLKQGKTLWNFSLVSSHSRLDPW